MRFLMFTLCVVFVLTCAVVPRLSQAAVFVVNSTADTADSLPGDGMCDTSTPTLTRDPTNPMVVTVTVPTPNGICTLRAAIEEANALPGQDTISFNIPGVGPHTIQTSLPVISDSVIIDGYTQPGAHPNTNPLGIASNAVLQIELIGGLLIISTNSTVRGLVINRSSSDAIAIDCRPLLGFPPRGWECASNTRIEGNFIGTDITGTLVLGNGRSGISISGTTAPRPLLVSNNTLVGNIIVGNAVGIEIIAVEELELSRCRPFRDRGSVKSTNMRHHSSSNPQSGLVARRNHYEPQHATPFPAAAHVF